MVKTDGKDLEVKIEKTKQPKTLIDWIKSKKNEIAIALPEGYSEGQMESMLMNTLRANPNLLKCTPISFICAAMQAAQFGLKPNTSLGHCYIIPYWNSKIKRHEAQFQLGYKGILELGYRTDEFVEIYAEKVYKGDIFDYELGTNKYLKHKPRPGKWEYDKRTEMPIVINYYAVYKTTKGATHFVVWTKEQMIKHKNRYSPAAKRDKYSPWNTSFDQMAKKTALKDLMKYAPLSENDKRILTSDETIKRELSKDMLEIPAIYEFDPDDLKGIEEEKKEIKRKPKSEVKSKPKEPKEPKEPKKPEIVIVKPTKSELKLMDVKRKGAGYTKEKFDKYLLYNYKAKTPMQLTKKQYNEIIKFLDKKIDEGIEKQGKLID